MAPIFLEFIDGFKLNDSLQISDSPFSSGWK